jgi:hypothetical protein
MERKAVIVGCAVPSCQRCGGRGFYNIDDETGEVQPCHCVNYYDMEFLLAQSQEDPEQPSHVRFQPKG